MELSLIFSIRGLPDVCTWEHQALDDFEGIRDHIFRIAYAMTLNYSAAEDVAQDCLIRVWRNRDKLSEVESPKAWVTQIVVNRVRSHWKQTPKWFSLSKVKQEVGEYDPSLIVLQQAMSSLPQDCREIALLIGVYGSSYSEVADALKIPEGTVGSRYNRAKALLKIALEETQ